MKTLIILLALQQPARITPFSSQLTIANYDDNLHGQYFPNFFTPANASMKPLAIVITNNYSQPLLAAQVAWASPSAVSVQQYNRISGGPISNRISAGPNASALAPGGMLLFLPDGMAVPANAPGPMLVGPAPRPLVGGIIGTLGGQRPPSVMAADPSTVTVTVDCAIFADGLVTGPDQYQLVAKLEAQADAINRLTAVVNAAKAQGRDPQADVAAAISDPALPIATRQYMNLLALGVNRNSGTYFLPPPMQLPNFHRQ